MIVARTDPWYFHRVKSLTKEWLAQAEYDLKTAGAMHKTRRYLYVAFMCQQAIEKLIKGIICKKKSETPPYSHRLVALLETAQIAADDRYLDLLDLLTGYYINARYPEKKQELARNLDKKKTASILSRTEECFQWLRKELKT